MIRPIKIAVAWFCIGGTALAQVYAPISTPDRNAAVNAVLDSMDPASPQVPVPAPSPSSVANTFNISGDARTSVGIYPNGDAVFTRANADLDEKNFRILSFDQLNNGINTYDPALYSRLKVVMDASVASAVVSVHLNVSVDPWSYTGKSSTQLVDGAGGDSAKVQYLFWGNTGYTVNTIVNTLQNGDSFALPEIKTSGNTVPATTVTSNFGNVFDIPSAKIDYSFQPFREAWVDIKTYNDGNIRIFPMAYENQALDTDDPLKLSGNKEWWDSSPWLNSWQAGNLNTGGVPVDFTKGQWDNSLAFFTKDSDGQRLTALRGVSIDLNPGDETSLKAAIASPKTLWQDYDVFTAVPASVRLKQMIGNLFYIGALGNMHQGFVNGNRDADNYVAAVDTGFIPLKWLKVSGEVSASQSRYDITSPAYETKSRGNAYYASLESTSNPEDMLQKDYYGLLPIDPADNFYKSKLFYARMDEGFESSLATYHGTRDDSFWSDHLTFYPSNYRYLPGVAPGMSEYDLEPFAIGNGIDYGRTSVGWRGDVSLMEGKLKGFADVRHVMDNNGDDIETVSRTQWTYKPTDKLTTKALLLWHALPKTVAGVDPFVTDGVTGLNLVNTSVIGGKDPSLKTGSMGARYALTDWAALNGVWEYTNDFTLGSDDFPQGDLNSSSFITYTENGRVYRRVYPFLYDQSYFDQAPYTYHNVFKTGLELTPYDKWHVYLDYTRNPNGFAGNIDDNMNHYGIETSYVPTPKIGFFARYTYSQGYDIDRLVYNNELSYRGYNDVFFEARMILPKDVTMSIQYGVGPAYNVQTSSSNPSLTYYATTTVVTQHIVRIVFDKKF